MYFLFFPLRIFYHQIFFFSIKHNRNVAHSAAMAIAVHFLGCWNLSHMLYTFRDRFFFCSPFSSLSNPISNLSIYGCIYLNTLISKGHAYFWTIFIIVDFFIIVQIFSWFLWKLIWRFLCMWYDVCMEQWTSIVKMILWG